MLRWRGFPGNEEEEAAAGGDKMEMRFRESGGI